jgi:hypothetical protein
MLLLRMRGKIVQGKWCWEECGVGGEEAVVEEEGQAESSWRIFKTCSLCEGARIHKTVTVCARSFSVRKAAVKAARESYGTDDDDEQQNKIGQEQEPAICLEGAKEHGNIHDTLSTWEAGSTDRPSRFRCTSKFHALIAQAVLRRS